MSDENVNAVPPEPEVSPPDEPGPEPMAQSAEELAEPFAPTALPSEPGPAPQEAEPVPSYPPPPPPPPPGGQYAPPPTEGQVRGGASEKNKLVAGILGILLGGLGIHKFYLGYTNEGIIMLAGNLLWIVGLGWLPNVVGLVEGVIYLFKSDQEFYDTYVAGTKKWF